MATNPVHKLGIMRLGLAGGVTAAAILILCWVGTAIPLSSPTHSYISLFTPADVKSVAALLEGSLWSLLFGTLSGALFAVIYNSFGRFDGRG